MKRDDKREKTIAQEVREFTEVTKGKFRVTDVIQWVTGVTRGNKAVLMSLSRLAKEGIVERLPEPGLYRVIENKMNAVDIQDVKPGTWLEIALPFGLEKYVNIASGNLIIFAGVTNAGKSALIFNMIKDNMKNHKCWYFSSEMNKETVKSRINLYEDNINWNFKVVDSWDQNIDILQPDDFNFLDWVEAGEDPFKVVAKLSAIQLKMKKGVAIVAMQKNPNNENAVGGFQTKNKSSLYLAVDQNFPHGEKLSIGKAKAFDDINPNGFCCKFKTYRGINLTLTDGWMPETEDKYKNFK